MDRIHAYCYHRTHDSDLAIDLTQQTFLQAMQAIPRFTPVATNSVRSWLFTIAHNLVVDTYRAARPIDSLHRHEHDGELPASDLSPAEQALVSARRTELFDAIAKLGPMQQQVIELRLAGLSGPEIADRLGMPLPAVKSAQYRAYRLLREALEDWHPANDGGGDRR